MLNHPVLTALLPVVMLIAVGVFAGKCQWVSATSAKDFAKLVFYVLCPALLFRTMSKVHLEAIDMKPVWVYFLAVFVVFTAVLFSQGFSRKGTVLALGGVFSNIVMIGVPLIGLAYGEASLTYLFTLISLHALIILTATTIVLEFAVVREQRKIQTGQTATPYAQLWRSSLLAVRNGVIHPVPLPILLGLLFAQTGWQIPGLLDRPLQLLGQAFGPMALVLVGITLAHTTIGHNLKAALSLATVKLLLLPACVALLGWCFGVKGLPYTVTVLAAAMPIGANVFLFSQRYEVAEDLITASVAITTALALLTVTLVMSWLGLV
jgi:malonate transporter and related proteins